MTTTNNLGFDFEHPDGTVIRYLTSPNLYAITHNTVHHATPVEPVILTDPALPPFGTPEFYAWLKQWHKEHNAMDGVSSGTRLVGQQ